MVRKMDLVAQLHEISLENIDQAPKKKEKKKMQPGKIALCFLLLVKNSLVENA